MVDNTDQAALCKAMEDAGEADITFAEYKRHFAKAWTAIRPGCKGGKAKPHSKVKYPKEFQWRETTLDEARLLAPPGSSLKLDTEPGRWWCQFMPTEECRSRSWRLYGHSESLRQILAWLWGEYLDSEECTREGCYISCIFTAKRADGRRVGCCFVRRLTCKQIMA